jgi:hypothetical protein
MIDASGALVALPVVLAMAPRDAQRVVLALPASVVGRRWQLPRVAWTLLSQPSSTFDLRRIYSRCFRSQRICLAQIYLQQVGLSPIALQLCERYCCD